ncbi:hypothetical protein [Streptosporangium sp. NPDC051022]|uniref:hypothetical protein n=1 Tax=Streptosporangium sp. NPDC051022 TaxID=3155752 RepID=UPI00341B281D
MLNHDVVEFVRRGYCGASTEFLVNVTTLATFRECLRAIRRYNRFDAEEVIGLLSEDLFGKLRWVQVGRATSPLIVARIASETYQQRDRTESENRLIPAEGMQRTARQLMKVGRRSGAESVTWIDEDGGVREGRPREDARPHTVRLWWR